MRYAAGVDVGSTQTKAVIIDDDEAIIGRSLIDTGADVTGAAVESYRLALEKSPATDKDVGYVIGTG